MTKQEFWQKWIVVVNGHNVPYRINIRKQEFFKDLDKFLETEWVEKMCSVMEEKDNE